MPEISEEELGKLKADAERATTLESSNKRLEGENSKYKTRAQEAEGKLTEAEKAKLEADGKTQELLDKERVENANLKEKYTKRTKDSLREKMRSEVSKHAKDAHDVDMILRVTDHKELLKTDEESLSVEGAKEFVEKVRETHSYLFSKKNLNPGDNKGPNNKNNDNEFKTEDEKYRSELDACSTRKELDAVKKKYGKGVAY